MFAPGGVVWGEEGEAVGELPEGLFWGLVSRGSNLIWPFEEGKWAGNVRQNVVKARDGTYTADSVVLVVILRLLDHVPPDDGLVAMVIVGFVADEVGLAQELLLVKLELAHHSSGFYVECLLAKIV